MPDSQIKTVVFDLGGVVLGWDPGLAFAEVLDSSAVPGFMEQISFPDWNRDHDAGRRFAEGERQLIDQWPDQAEAIRAYRQHFDRTLLGEIPGTGAIIAELERAGIRLLALTNWSDETFPVAYQRFGILSRFEGIVVSGAEQLAKPDPALFKIVFDRHEVQPEQSVFIDDSAANCESAAGLGMTAIQFSDAAQLRDRLVELGLLGPPEAVQGPIFHLAERSSWETAVRTGEYPWSSRGVTYEQEGFVHCSWPHQVDGVRERFYADLDPSDLVCLELDPATLSVPVIAEARGTVEAYPHLYGPLPVAEVSGS